MERSDWVVEPLGEYMITVSTTNERSEWGGDRNNHDEPLGEAFNNSDGMSVWYSYCLLFLIMLLLTYLSWIRFQEGSQSVNLTIQPRLLPERLKEGRSYELIMGVIDRGERGDQNALGLSFIRRVEVKICTIIWFYFVVRVPPCTIHHWNYTRLVLPLVQPMFYWIVWCVADWFEWGNFCYHV